MTPNLCVKSDFKNQIKNLKQCGKFLFHLNLLTIKFSNQTNQRIDEKFEREQWRGRKNVIRRNICVELKLNQTK